VQQPSFRPDRQALTYDLLGSSEALLAFDHDRLTLQRTCTGPLSVVWSSLQVVAQGRPLLHVGPLDLLYLPPLGACWTSLTGKSWTCPARQILRFADERRTDVSMPLCSYYPLYPPSLGTCLDTSLGQALDMPCTPDIMLYPSDLAPFAKLVPCGVVPDQAPSAAVPQNTVCINPGRLVRDKSGATYAWLQVCIYMDVVTYYTLHTVTCCTPQLLHLIRPPKDCLQEI